MSDKISIFRTPKLLYIIGAIIILSTIASVIFVLIRELTDDDEFLSSSGSYLAHYILSTIIIGVGYAGIIVGLAGFIYSRSNLNLKHSVKISLGLYYSAGFIFALTLASILFMILAYEDDGFRSGWSIAESVAWELTQGIFFAGILYVLAFLALRRSDAVIPLPSSTDDEIFTYPCPKCYKPVESNWELCPYCTENLIQVEIGFYCSKCGRDVEKDWLICPECQEPLDEDTPAE